MSGSDGALCIVCAHRLHNTHAPFQSPPEFSTLYNYTDPHRNTFMGMVSAVESTVMNVTGAMRAAGLWENSVFVWATDNGSPVNAGGSNHPLRGSKGGDWEGGVRVPAFLSGGVVEALGTAGKTLNGIVAIADLFTTFAALAGVDGTAEPNPESPSAVDGLDMWKYFSGANATSPRAEYVYDNLNFTKGEY